MKGPPGWVLLIHPDDAKARGLSSGERARVSSRVGSVEVPVGITADVAGARQAGMRCAGASPRPIFP